MDVSRMLQMTARYRIWALLLAYAILYTFMLDRVPLVWMDEAWDSATPWNFITHGVWGNSLFDGLGNYGTHDYTGMPMLLVLQVPVFALLGLGVFQARLVAVICGLTTVLFTYLLAKRLYNDQIALAAVSILAITPLFFIGSRIVRYEIAVTAFTVVALYLYVRAREKDSRLLYLATGAAASMAFLSHLTYGIFCPAAVLALFAIDRKRDLLKGGMLIAFIAGAAALLLPYVAWVSLDIPGYVSQMQSAAAERVGFTSAGFYIENLLTEPSRWAHDYVLLSVIPWLIGFVYVAWRWREHREILTVMVIFIAGLALLNHSKYEGYLLPLTPFFSMAVAAFFAFALKQWRLSGKSVRRKTPALVAALLLVLLAAQAAWIPYMLYKFHGSDYYGVTARIDALIPPDAVVIGEPVYWYGLHGHPYYASNLLTYLHRHIPEHEAVIGRNVSEAMDRLGVDIILYDGMFKSQVNVFNYIPATDMEDFLASHTTLIGIVNDSYYGDSSGNYDRIIEIYQINRSTQG